MTGQVSEVVPPADGAGFVEWVRPHLPAMARVAARLAVGADRDDIVQESLARAWTKRQQYDAGRGSASAWLLAITADQARKAARRMRPVAALEDHDAAEVRPDVDARLDVDQALGTLSARQRLAVDCYYFADLSVADTAAVMGCSEGTVKSTLSDARARLRSLLEVSE
ncbi:RNA polymerase sigma-70 factor (ECF subfamily) [Kribbella sp. VKM Ac-2527]|uniref:RNA polymerase sigma-70 factor (ECF subfamily) n=1 Tax=Kribbella caucasensis TaxID=2512215 RepID=A0A4R6JI07_9ACTN|nr:RNA polymerase sigma factor [Kribbella sp. VKM Ac-2527]TDO35659.1 RNA polymerase sigma-70 factor (ECF subfamily) [Kribbella sp. VKM Ac-2527]